MDVKKPRILVADDEMIMRMFIVSVLKKMDCEIVGQAADGNEAVEMFRKNKPDLLLMDINMPVKTGEEALGEILSEFPDARVIMLTSVVDAETVRQCVERGAVGYIRKDSSVEEIKSIISENLRQEGA